MSTPDLPVFESLDQLARLVEHRTRVFVRWSKGPGVDVPRGASRDDLTGNPLPGLSANSLDVEPWWGDRPVRAWVARRLYDYSHLPHDKGPEVFPWVFEGEEVGRGPDNEPLVRCREPLGAVSSAVIRQAAETVEEIDRQSDGWGPLRRPRHS